MLKGRFQHNLAKKAALLEEEEGPEIPAPELLPKAPPASAAAPAASAVEELVALG